LKSAADVTASGGPAAEADPPVFTVCIEFQKGE
jgi:hypothetical protein